MMCLCLNLLTVVIRNRKKQKDESKENPPFGDCMCDRATQCPQCAGWLHNRIKSRVIAGKDINQNHVSNTCYEAGYHGNFGPCEMTK